MGLVIEKTKSFPCVIVKKTFQVTCGVGHGKGRVKSIPKADRGIGKRVSQIVLKMSGNFVQSGCGK